MDYPLENLGPEKFQQFCQALLIQEFPNVQCFPVAQPDGGRDSTSLFMSPTREGFLVFQVKFTRKPLEEKEPHKWLSGILKDESPKIERLIPRGASGFYLLTNIPGTAHLDNGSIDKVDAILRENISIPSQCWWRDDINRRLDSAWDLKWIYPELMTGPDLLRSIFESGMTEQKEQRTSTIKAFLRDQYDIDREVRFKQVELQNRLLDLFIDVPVTFSHQHSGKKQRMFEYRRILESVLKDTPHREDELQTVYETHNSLDEGIVFREDALVGTATFLLHALTQAHIPRMVIEGAPGQGKSTIAQYVCQVHRMRLLKKDNDLSRIAESHRSSPVRIPFKIDLRDLATWLSKKDPFSAEENEELPDQWKRSLEAFLAAQVRHHSGGADFSYEDLIAVLKLSSVLLVFDGLDEIADISRRQEVVDEIMRGVNRLEENAVSLQVIVTSRPAAFANSPGLPSEKFPYYHLSSVTRELINEYAENWLKARKIQGRQRSEFKRILKNKLDQPHLRDLARNPMQLAILLSLIHTRGSSLPDKRTALYDSYVELFFSREAEKSPIVREYRDLLIDIHRYLAWTLHSEAEQGHDRGSISTDRLKVLLSNYLTEEGHDVFIAEKLFTGMVERVVALVSRVEGSFEFEVQPLREYFAARYLYETAPYSPPGAEKRGTKPDRFDAIARDFYWLNVTRFYAGCFSKGELPSLVDRLQELTKEDGYHLISHPRVLAATLLSDWVFSQHPKSVKAVVKLILDGIGLRYILSVDSKRYGSGSPMVLPEKCGQDELIDRCFSLLRTNPPLDYCYEIIGLIKANSTTDNINNLWFKNVPEKHLERTRWVNYGLYLGILSKMPLSDLENLLSDAPSDATRLSFLYRAKRFDYLESTESTCRAIIDAILDTQVLAQQNQRGIGSIIELFSLFLDPLRYAIAFTNRRPIPLQEILKRNNRVQVDGAQNNQRKQTLPHEVLGLCVEVSNIAEIELQRTGAEWATELAPWDNIVESTRSAFGDRWALFCLANVAAGIKSQKETCVGFEDLLNHSKSICRRVRYARLRAGNVNWWSKLIESTSSQTDYMLMALILFTWGSSSTLVSLVRSIESFLTQLTQENWYLLMNSVQRTLFSIHQGWRNNPLSFDLSKIPSDLSDRTATAFGIRAKKEAKEFFYHNYFENYEGADHITLEFCQNVILDRSKVRRLSWNPNLELIAKSYAEGIVSFPVTFHHYFQYNDAQSLPKDVAQKIASNPDKYPCYLVTQAETTCKDIVSSNIIPVGTVAEKEGWFTT
ncbi:MAG: NACHT domain-containing protein [Proteobacteria bacterium]|nr:NACHT domain-containing protein [Pseudomonadota bacterium]MBU1057816.1 NACHT domain-containing protein [Pseudomonadota bacterium]